MKIIRQSKCIVLCIFCALIVYSFVGCKKEPLKVDMDEMAVDLIRRGTQNPIWPQEARDRAELAIDRLKNSIHDPEPILISAKIELNDEGNDSYLMLLAYDEDKDLLGFGIKEEHIKSDNSKRTIEEDYPVDTHSDLSNKTIAHRVIINERKFNEKKNEQLWQEYTNRNYEEIIQEYLESDRSERSTYTIPRSDESHIDWGIVWEDTLPPIYISRPDPNKVDIWIFVYDKAGNKSESVRIIDLDMTNYKTNTNEKGQESAKP